MHPLQRFNDLQDRRQFLRGSAMGLGGIALGSLMNESLAAADSEGPA